MGNDWEGPKEDPRCLHRGRCGKPKGDHKVHVQYDTGGRFLESWWDPADKPQDPPSANDRLG